MVSDPADLRTQVGEAEVVAKPQNNARHPLPSRAREGRFDDATQLDNLSRMKRAVDQSRTVNPPPVNGSQRRREVTWEDPLLGAARSLEMSGLDYLSAVVSGNIPRPPLAALLGMDIDTVEPGRATFSLHVGEHLYNPIGSVHGGRTHANPILTRVCWETKLLPSRNCAAGHSMRLSNSFGGTRAWHSLGRRLEDETGGRGMGI